MEPAIDKPHVEKAMDECDALGEAAFVEKYGLKLTNIRYRVLRGSKRYPSKAIANAAYTMLHGKDGPYGGTQARKALAAVGYNIVEGENGVTEDERPPGEVRLAAVKAVNLILYGPPGTGKTYATAVHAVRLCLSIAEGHSLLQDSSREPLMEEYRRLVDARRIQFVTFHQSYSYEEFVEGLRPDTGSNEPLGPMDTNAASGEPIVNNSTGFRLVPTPGIFREISALAEQARKTLVHGTKIDVGNRRVFKMSLGRAGLEDHIFDAALDGGYIALGWGGDEDWSDTRFDGEKGYEAIRSRWQNIAPDMKNASGHISQLYQFRSLMQKDDLVVISNGNSGFRAIGRIDGPYYFDKNADSYSHRRKVDWLLGPSDPLPADIIYSKPFTQRSCYLLKDDFLKRDALQDILSGAHKQNGEPNNYVLVIDEINRANISKVFGELITLVEPDKRIGETNEIKVRLPYSRVMFGVPPNLHIVGTMNTADRSIALLDTALRRRFDFVELMPEPNRLLEDVDGVPLRSMLKQINARIEHLFDREHQIGHGFFMSCSSKSDIDRVMRLKVLPLLQEYFFEDWEKVAIVLGDEHANSGEGKFVFWEQQKRVDKALADDADEINDRRRWSVRLPFAPDAYVSFRP